MIYPIYAYGHPILRKVAEPIGSDYPNLKEVIANMYETMQASSGVGLAAPQVGLSIRLLVIDADPFKDEDPSLEGFRKTFINIKIEEETGEKWVFNEGCLSVPNIREDVARHPVIKVTYLDEDFNPHEEVFKGLIARIIQHEYDHLQGVLFVDRVSSLRKTLLKRKLNEITRGIAKVSYKMKFPSLKK